MSTGGGLFDDKLTAGNGRRPLSLAAVDRNVRYTVTVRPSLSPLITVMEIGWRPLSLASGNRKPIPPTPVGLITLGAGGLFSGENGWERAAASFPCERWTVRRAHTATACPSLSMFLSFRPRAPCWRSNHEATFIFGRPIFRASLLVDTLL